MTDHIQIGNVSPRIQYVGNASQTAFPYPFPIFQAADLEVYLGAVKQTGGYTVTGAGASGGGTCTFATAPSDGALVTLRRRLTIQRTTDHQADGIIRAKTLNDELDYQTAGLQQVAEDAGRAVKRAITSGSTADLTLPEPVAGKALGWNADATGLTNDPADFAGTVATVTDEAAAAASARAAADADAAATAADRVAAHADRLAADADAAATAADRAAVAADKVAVAANTATVAADKAIVASDKAAADADAAATAADRVAVHTDKLAADADAAATAADRAAVVADMATVASDKAAAIVSAALASDWSIKMSGTVDGTDYSAKYWAGQAAAAANVWTFANIAVSGQSTVSADQASDTLTLAGSTHVVLTTDAATDTVTFALTGIATVGYSGVYSDLTGKPTLGAAAALDVGVGGVQAYNAKLADIAGITWAQGDVLYHNGTNVVKLAAGTSGQFLKTQGAGANPVWAALVGGAASVSVQSFTAGGTYTKPTGLLFAIVEVWGGGAAGGGAPNATQTIGGGGGSGQYSRKLILASAIGSTETVTIGAGGTGVSNANGNNGGTSSFGALVSSAGGTGGTKAVSQDANYSGGPGGTGGSGGDLIINGRPGFFGVAFVAGGYVQGGHGGAAPNGGAGGVLTSWTTNNSAAGVAPGGGGSGGIGTGVGAGTGGAGAAGKIVVWEFKS